MEHIQLGQKGEQIAVQHLAKNGYKIVEQNWRYKHKEIDIIAKKDHQLIVVEVKSRTSEYYEPPYESVTKAKMRFLLDATEAYILKKDLDMEVRFDIISIVFEKDTFELEHIEDAFSAFSI